MATFRPFGLDDPEEHIRGGRALNSLLSSSPSASASDVPVDDVCVTAGHIAVMFKGRRRLCLFDTVPKTLRFAEHEHQRVVRVLRSDEFEPLDKLGVLYVDFESGTDIDPRAEVEAGAGAGAHPVADGAEGTTDGGTSAGLNPVHIASVVFVRAGTGTGTGRGSRGPRVLVHLSDGVVHAWRWDVLEYVWKRQGRDLVSPMSPGWTVSCAMYSSAHETHVWWQEKRMKVGAESGAEADAESPTQRPAQPQHYHHHHVFARRLRFLDDIRGKRQDQNREKEQKENAGHGRGRGGIVVGDDAHSRGRGRGHVVSFGTGSGTGVSKSGTESVSIGRATPFQMSDPVSVVSFWHGIGSGNGTGGRETSTATDSGTGNRTSTRTRTGEADFGLLRCGRSGVWIRGTSALGSGDVSVSAVTIHTTGSEALVLLSDGTVHVCAGFADGVKARPLCVLRLDRGLDASLNPNPNPGDKDRAHKFLFFAHRYWIGVLFGRACALYHTQSGVLVHSLPSPAVSASDIGALAPWSHSPGVFGVWGRSGVWKLVSSRVVDEVAALVQTPGCTYADAVAMCKGWGLSKAEVKFALDHAVSVRHGFSRRSAIDALVPLLSSPALLLAVLPDPIFNDDLVAHVRAFVEAMGDGDGDGDGDSHEADFGGSSIEGKRKVRERERERGGEGEGDRPEAFYAQRAREALAKFTTLNEALRPLLSKVVRLAADAKEIHAQAEQGEERDRGRKGAGEGDGHGSTSAEAQMDIQSPTPAESVLAPVPAPAPTPTATTTPTPTPSELLSLPKARIESWVRRSPAAALSVLEECVEQRPITPHDSSDLFELLCRAYYVAAPHRLLSFVRSTHKSAPPPSADYWVRRALDAVPPASTLGIGIGIGIDRSEVGETHAQSQSQAQAHPAQIDAHVHLLSACGQSTAALRLCLSQGMWERACQLVRGRSASGVEFYELLSLLLAHASTRSSREWAEAAALAPSGLSAQHALAVLQAVSSSRGNGNGNGSANANGGQDRPLMLDPGDSGLSVAALQESIKW